MTNRLGLSLILIGMLAMLVFAISALNQQGDLTTLLGGAILCVIGLWFRRRAVRTKEQQSLRFQTLRRIRGVDEEVASEE